MAQELSPERYLVQPGQPVRLEDFDPDDHGEYADKQQAKEALKALRDELDKLQRVLYAENKRTVLVVFQAMDTGGKDGVIRDVFTGVNPMGIQVHSFKTPTPEELAHDYLWRIHKAMPPRGIIGIFNRSHYEDVLIVRVQNLVPHEVWGMRYEQIYQFEKYLAECGVTILKFYLHISKDEQRERLQARLDDPNKRWKFAVGDLKHRSRWGEYMAAYEEAINRTSAPWAPWYVVPANRKWYRNLVVAHAIIDTLREFEMRYPEPAENLDEIVIPE